MKKKKPLTRLVCFVCHFDKWTRTKDVSASIATEKWWCKVCEEDR